MIKILYIGLHNHLKNTFAIHFNAISVFPAKNVRYTNYYSANIRKNKKKVYFKNERLEYEDVREKEMINIKKT
jgi:predicted nucleic-acid-binding Zn-ribbon protein